MRRLAKAMVIVASVTILSAVQATIASEESATQITREEFDAAVLSQGTSTDGFINREMAARTLAALKAIRSKFPEVANIHARPSVALDTLLVGLTADSQKIIQRQVTMTADSPKEELITGGTGITNLDQLNAKYGVTSVSTFYSTEALIVRFQKPMDIAVLSNIYARASGVQGIGTDPALGDGDEINLKRGNQAWLFAFKHGWGDCPAGCIDNQYWFFSYQPETQTVKKIGEHMGRLHDEELWKQAEGGGR